MAAESIDVKRLISETGIDDAALELHRRLAGKVSVEPKIELTEETLELLYTPGVGAVSRALAEDGASARELTWTGNSVAVISDGSAVLGLGDEGPVASLPVLEGKALLFKALAGIDAVALPLHVADADAFVDAACALAPSFGAINLEDIEAPRCFEVERSLRERLDIPVLHDDQHGTAVVVLAGLLNAARVTERELGAAKVVIVGAGAGGTATARLLSAHGVGSLAVTDSDGALNRSRDDLDAAKRALVDELELDDEGSTSEVVEGADVLIGLSVPSAFTDDDVRRMSDDAIVFALANPDPEVDPDSAREAGAAVVATGRSDYPNQVNNVLAFPGLFRGALDAAKTDIDDRALLAAADALAGVLDSPTADAILPGVLDDGVVEAVAAAVRRDT